MNQTTKRTTGAAHIGFSMFGARAPLLAPEDAGGAAGGSSGGDGTTTTTTSQAAQTTTTTGDSATAAGGNGKTFTQEQVNSIVGAARREARDAALREAQQQAAAANAAKATPKSDADRLAALEAELAETKQRSAFDKKAAKHGVLDDAADDLFILYKAQHPANEDEWFSAKAARFATKAGTGPVAPSATGTNPGAAGAAPANPNAPVTDPAKPPAAASSAPSKVDQLTNAGLLDIWNLSDAQLMQLGPAGLRKEFEKILGVAMQQQGAPPRPQPAKRS